MCKNNNLLFILFLIFGISIVYGNDNNQNIMELGDELNYKNIKFIKNETFEKIKNIFTSKEFSGEFKYMDLNKNIYYREKYLEVLKMKKEYIEDNYEEIFDEKESNNKEKILYHFFDINNDNIPELIVNNKPYSTDIFTFDLKSKRVKKVISLSSGAEFFGGNKVYLWDGGIGFFENYFKIDNSGNFISTIIFYSAGSIDEDLYTIGAWDDSIEFNQLKMIAKENNENLYYNQIRGVYCFRITEEQSDELMKPYLKIRKKAEENIKKVTYTYDELFGEFDKTKKIVLDISTWTHPTKEIFLSQNIELAKVIIDDKKFPIFYISKMPEKFNILNYNFLSDLAEKNGFWDFGIKTKDNLLKVVCDKSKKRVVKIEMGNIVKQFDNYTVNEASIIAKNIIVEKENLIYLEKEKCFYKEKDETYVMLKNIGFDKEGRYEVRMSPANYPLSVYKYLYVDLFTKIIYEEFSY